jgi:hypothetical protein
MGTQQPYYGYQQQPMAAAMPITINKRLVFMIIALGGLLLWIAQLALGTMNITDAGTRRLLTGLYLTGAAIGFGGAVLGSLGSPRTSDWQNVGLMILAGFFLLILG